MKEEIKEGMSSLKKGIIGVAGTMAAAIGTYVTTQFNSLIGIEDESGAPTEMVAPVENNNTQQQSVNVTGPEIIINIPEQKAAPATRTIVKETIREVPAAPVEVVEEKPETPMERMARLKKERAEAKGGN
jgi:actin-like ATPase involved in cell morphogenesis